MTTTSAVLELPRVGALTSVDPREIARHFDAIYHEAQGDPARVPWHRDGPNPPLVSWLNAEAPHLVRTGASAIVVGCGLGDDVAELASRGYDASGFDLSPCAAEWARRRHHDIAESFFCADLLGLPSHLRARFDLVVEVYTIQSLPPALRPAAVAAVASLMRPKGTLLVVCRGRDEHEPLDEAAEPPYPLTVSELTSLAARQGLSPTRDIDDFQDDEAPPRRRLRAAFRRG